MSYVYPLLYERHLPLGADTSHIRVRIHDTYIRRLGAKVLLFSEIHKFFSKKSAKIYIFNVFLPIFAIFTLQNAPFRFSFKIHTRSQKQPALLQAVFYIGAPENLPIFGESGDTSRPFI